MYGIMVFLHVLGVFGFLLAHGGSAAVMFQVRREREPERLCALIELSRSTQGLMYGALLLILATGIVAGVIGKWWGKGWIWTALGLLLVMATLMSFWGREYFDKVLAALGQHTYATRKQGLPPPAPAAPGELDALLRKAQPERLAVVGLGGLVAILFLMMYKPF